MKLRNPYPSYFVLVALVLYVVFLILPNLSGLAYAFTDWSSYSSDVNFIGLANFQTIFTPGEQYLIDNTPSMQTLPFSGLQAKLLPNQQAFLDAHTDQGTVYQTAVTYVNPQWIDIGKDLTAMFTGAMQPEDVLVNIDKRRAQLALAAKDPAWGS